MTIDKKETVKIVYKSTGKDDLWIEMDERKLPTVWQGGCGKGFESFTQALEYISKEYCSYRISHIKTIQRNTYE